MKANAEGFLYPFIDEGKCTLCGTCVEICPAHPLPVDGTAKDPAVFAAWTRDRELLQNSTSGGAFSELARTVLEKGGVVFGAAYDEHLAVRQTAVETWDELGKLRGSKYVQSAAADSFDAVLKCLTAGRAVLYSGTPCLIAGLYAAIGRDHENLLTCCVICHGVPSPKVFRKYLDAMAVRHRREVRHFAFRDKRSGWKYPTIRIELDRGRTLYESNITNEYNRGFLNNVFLRSVCYQCPHKTGGLVGDIIIGDFWELIKFQPKLLNPRGTSAMIGVTGKGLAAIKACLPRMEMVECPFEYLEHDSNLRKCAVAKGDRAGFFADLDRLSFWELTAKYLRPRGFAERNAARIKRFLLAVKNRVRG
jgi:coenzyme F420-reducing hydrogenase beta subunit